MLVIHMATHPACFLLHLCLLSALTARTGTPQHGRSMGLMRPPNTKHPPSPAAALRTVVDISNPSKDGMAAYYVAVHTSLDNRAGQTIDQDTETDSPGELAALHSVSYRLFQQFVQDEPPSNSLGAREHQLMLHESTRQ